MDAFIKDMPVAKCDFRASATLKLHERVVDCLNMIVQCDNRIYNSKVELKRQYVYGEYRQFLDEKIAKHEAIKQRLTRYYIDIMSRIEKIAIRHIEQFS